MHEVSLGQTIRDYLTGTDIENTTYEDLRQALAQLMVEELGYPAALLEPRISVRFPVDGKQYCRTVDLAAQDDDGRPFLYILFVPGQVNTFTRESLAAARLGKHGPVPLVAVTDTRDALLLETAGGTTLRDGMRALPPRSRALELARQHPAVPLTPERTLREQRILYTYSEFMKTCCDESVCML
ncbi:type I restriction enzyme HsdR N-terminal domain-containing protein [Oleidesulfovibrio alaskensis]|jgi:hypothetical protein|uniref:type I restriction enzyme HsdR N-terminal domain-containing protein n=1 Tax=Oleidesulfovibrio alaskensis TaxID=58180 RepID=UPI000405F9F0|nr:type I restriction enzyme HsdR N-terminal domain-containing protein [Oleidesulfovibrio alaskensis]